MTDLPLSSCSWDALEIKAINQVVKSGSFTMGKKVEEFENLFAKFVGSKYALMVNSGSSANLLAIASLFYCDNPLKIGDEVIVPSVSWSTTYSPLVQYGLILKFVDIDYHTLNLDLESMANAISDKTRAIFTVNLIGNPIDYVKMKEIIGSKNIRIIEDNCESLGAIFEGKQAGTFGILGTFSTYFSHHISTIEGGIVVTNDKQLYHILLSLRSHGWTRHLPFDTNICVKNKDSFYNLFDFILPGYNLRPTELSGAIGIEQLVKLPSIIEGRRKNGKIFQEMFKNIPRLHIQTETGESSWFGFALIVDNKVNRDKLVGKFTKNNIECRPIVAGNFCKNPVIKYFKYTIHDNLKISDIIHDCGIYIGNHHFNLENKLAFVKNLIIESQIEWVN